MSTSTGAASLNRTLSRAHGAALGCLGLCAVGIALAAGGPAPAAVDSRFTGGAVALAVSSIIARRIAAAPDMRPAGRVTLGVLACACAAGIGFLALLLVLQAGSWQTGLALTAGGAILTLRRPTPVRAGGDEQD